MNKIAIILMAFLPTACAVEYACEDFPEGGCHTVSDVYDNIKNGGVHQAEDESDQIEDLSRPSMKSGLNPGLSPLLGKPDVLRIYIAPWIDDEDDFEEGSFVYVKISGSRWLKPSGERL